MREERNKEHVHMLTHEQIVQAALKAGIKCCLTKIVLKVCQAKPDFVKSNTRFTQYSS